MTPDCIVWLDGGPPRPKECCAGSSWDHRSMINQGIKVEAMLCDKCRKMWITSIGLDKQEVK